jgi:signal peptidase I
VEPSPARAIAVNLVLVTLSLAAVPRVEAASPEYVQITGRRDSKYPAIADGDTVTVEMITEVNTIKVGDIIVYGSIASLAWNPNPTSIWIAHRVTEKYVKDGGLCFRTKGDNKRSRGDISIFIAQIPFFW